MPIIRIPTPLRPYTGGSAEVSVAGDTVGAALNDLTVKHPDLRKHLYTEGGELRAFVNVFLAQEDVRHLQGEKTPLKDADQLRIVPSVAGGRDSTVDHAALQVNQLLIILLLIIAFVLNNLWVVVGVAVVMILGTVVQQPGFKPVYFLLRAVNLVKPEVVADNREPHLFAQALGATFVTAGAVAIFYQQAATIGWALAWVVIVLAALNLFGGFCAGCFVYYWFNRIHVPGFAKTPPPNTFPGMKPKGS